MNNCNYILQDENTYLIDADYLISKKMCMIITLEFVNYASTGLNSLQVSSPSLLRMRYGLQDFLKN